MKPYHYPGYNYFLKPLCGDDIPLLIGCQKQTAFLRLDGLIGQLGGCPDDKRAEVIAEAVKHRKALATALAAADAILEHAKGSLPEPEPEPKPEPKKIPGRAK